MAPRKKSQFPLIQILIGLGALLVGAVWYQMQPNQTVTVPPGDFLFCFWNVENLFDDVDNGLNGRGDKEKDNWYSQNKHDLNLKLNKITEAMLKLNNGKGPDILALVEVENLRAANLVKEALNKKISDPNLHYKHVLMKEVRVGRHIAPVIITRLPVVGNRTRQYDKRRRIVEGRVKVNGKELIIVASHWTSRLHGGESGRATYAQKIYGAYKAMYKNNPKVDYLLCGDFNDTPEDVSITHHLKAKGDVTLVQKDSTSPVMFNPSGLGEPILFNLFANKDPRKFGTHYYKSKNVGPWYIFDQIIVSPGMLDREGWTCNVDSAQTIRTLVRPGDRLQRPWSFGSRSDDPTRRGYSDHFPVVVTLSVK